MIICMYIYIYYIIMYIVLHILYVVLYIYIYSITLACDQGRKSERLEARRNII